MGNELTKQQPGERPQKIEIPPDPRLARMRQLSRFLDNSILLPGGYRIGVDPLIGLVPGVGDVIASALSFWLIYDAARLGLSRLVLTRMVGNVLLESLVGTIPLLGDLFDAAWKANARNMRLVELHYTPALQPRSSRSIMAGMILAALLVLSLLFTALYFSFKLVAGLVEKLF